MFRSTKVQVSPDRKLHLLKKDIKERILTEIGINERITKNVLFRNNSISIQRLFPIFLRKTLIVGKC